MNERSLARADAASASDAAPRGGILRRKCACAEQSDRDEIPRLRRAIGPSIPHDAGLAGVPPVVHDVLRSSAPTLDPAEREFFEPRLYRDFSHVPLRAATPRLSPSEPLEVGSPGDASEAEADVFAARVAQPLDVPRPSGRFDLSGVQIHTGPQADASARALGARAFAVGNHVVFAAGEFSPQTQAGRTLLAHELAHVAQQGGSLKRTIRRSLAGCQALLNEVATRLIPGRMAHQYIQTDFMSKAKGAMAVAIPGASAAPLRALGICGADSKVVQPQMSGGKAGMGYPDLAMKNAAGVLQVAEIKPAAIECLIDGETQELTYIDQGNAQDAPQVAWRAALGISVVSPMLPSSYQPPTLELSIPTIGSVELKTAWCGPGLMAYALKAKRSPEKAPVTAADPKKEKDKEKSSLKRVTDFLQDLIEAGVTSGAKLDDALQTFFRENPQLINVVIAASVGVILATLAEDIATLGAGILDDVVMIPIAVRAIAIARQAAAALALAGGTAAYAR